MKEAIIVCDGVCLSASSLIDRMKEVQSTTPDFRYRFASPEEAKLFMNAFETIFTPFVVIGDAALFGVPQTEKILALITY